MNDRPLLECTGISKEFRAQANTVVALSSTELKIEYGDALAVVGPSGSGKSTLLALLAGLERPSSGEISFRGQPYAKLSVSALARLRREHMGFVFQSANLLAGMTVKENVAVPLWLNGWPSAKASKRVAELLERLSIADLGNRGPRTLSGGEAQRVALARALAHRPQLIFADEPTGSLDRDNATVVGSLFVEAVAAEGCAVIVATHNHELADRMKAKYVLGAA